jgi:hypothetical protein
VSSAHLVSQNMQVKMLYESSPLSCSRYQRDVQVQRSCLSRMPIALAVGTSCRQLLVAAAAGNQSGTELR